MRILTATALVLLLAAPIACSKSEKREWSASDHDQPEENQPAQRTAPPSQPPPAAAQNDDPWASTCAPCHGASGKGDGPMGAAMSAPNLANPDWQAKVTDQQIADTIKNGRGRMPGFASLPQSSVDALVKHVRSFK